MTSSKDPSVKTFRPTPARRGNESRAVPQGARAQTQKVEEIGGRRNGPEPTRYGDWEKNGRCIDF